MPDLPNNIREIGQAFADGLLDVLGDKLYSATIYGAAAFLDTLPTGDIDFHVILTESLTEAERTGLDELHASLARAFPPLGREMDGYYILLENARQTSPPKSQMWQGAIDNAWALHRAHIWAGRCITLYGPDPAQFYPPATWPELEEALVNELAYVKSHLADYPDYCILNLCRLIYSFETRDVVLSKAAAADWAIEALPEWAATIELAKKSYAGLATAEDRELMLVKAQELFLYASERIDESRQQAGTPIGGGLGQ